MNGVSLQNLCIVTAVDIEFRTATGLLNQVSINNDNRFSVCRGGYGSKNITVLKTGMGAVGFPEFLSKHLTQNRYDALVVAGLAGALIPELKRNQTVIYDSILKPTEFDKNSIKCNDKLSAILLESLKNLGITCFTGPGLTIDSIISRAEDKIAIGKRYGASAVDMETYKVLETALHYDIPTAVVRVISDVAVDDIPDFNRATGKDGQINVYNAIIAMLYRPVASFRFLIGIKPVIQSLRANLSAILDA